MEAAKEAAKEAGRACRVASGALAGQVEAMVDRSGSVAHAQHLGLILDADANILSRKVFNKAMSRWTMLDWLLGTQLGQLTALLVVAAMLICFGALFWLLTGGNADYNDTWWEALWFSWGMFFDPGTQMGFAADEPGRTKSVAVIFSILGFTYNLLMLGMIVEIVKQALERWRRNRGRIVANGHTLLLGWAEKSLFVIDELLLSARKRNTKLNLVILAEEDPYEINREIARHFTKNGLSADITIREGSPSECDELARVSSASASNIFVLGGTGNPRIVDLSTVRTVVALAALPQAPTCPIIAEVRALETSSAIRAVSDTAEGIFALGAVKRVLCLMAVQPLVAQAFRELMSWRWGASIFCESLQALGVASCITVQDAQNRIERGIVIGVSPESSHADIAPAANRVLQSTDRLLVLADSRKEVIVDFDPLLANIQSGLKSVMRPGLTRRLSGPVGSAAHHTDGRRQTSAEATIVVIVGWPTDADDILSFLDDYIERGSVVEILAPMAEEERQRRLSHSRGFQGRNCEIRHRVGSTTSLFALSGLPLNEASAVLVLADHSLHEDPRLSDSANVAACVTIDGLLEGRHPELFKPSTGRGRPRLICEVLSAETDRALGSSSAKDSALTRLDVFQTSALEAALFTIASIQAPVFNCFVQLLRRSNDFGEFLSVSAQAYLKDRSDTGMVGIEVLRELVRQAGDVFLGYFPEHSIAPTVLPVKRPELTVSADVRLLVITKRAEDLEL